MLAPRGPQPTTTSRPDRLQTPPHSLKQYLHIGSKGPENTTTSRPDIHHTPNSNDVTHVTRDDRLAQRTNILPSPAGLLLLTKLCYQDDEYNAIFSGFASSDEMRFEIECHCCIVMHVEYQGVRADKTTNQHALVSCSRAGNQNRGQSHPYE